MFLESLMGQRDRVENHCPIQGPPHDPDLGVSFVPSVIPRADLNTSVTQGHDTSWDAFVQLQDL